MNTADFENGYLRAEKIFHLASQGQGDAMIDDLFELYDDDPEAFQEALTLPSLDVEDKEELSWFLDRNQKNGFLVQMATPVPSNFNERGGFMTNGWGHYSTKYFYAETIEDCYSQGAKWQKEYYEQVKQKEAA